MLLLLLLAVASGAGVSGVCQDDVSSELYIYMLTILAQVALLVLRANPWVSIALNRARRTSLE